MSPSLYFYSLKNFVVKEVIKSEIYVLRTRELYRYL